MTAYNFGAGTLIGRRTDVTTPTPVLFGVLQDVTIDFKQDLKELVGQLKFAVDVAPAQMKITGKGKFARIQAAAFNDIFFGPSGTLSSTTSGGAETMSLTNGIAEQHAAAASITVTNGATFQADLGVFYAATGVALTAVASSPAVGQYVPGAASVGTYTFNAGETGTLSFYYRYTASVTGGNKISIANTLMGTGSLFEVNLQETYKNNAGTTGNMLIRLNACRSDNFSMAFKNTDYTIPDFGFQAFADASGTIGELTFTE